jgi:hypothetical protein
MHRNCEYVRSSTLNFGSIASALGMPWPEQPTYVVRLAAVGEAVLLENLFHGSRGEGLERAACSAG